VPDNLVIDHTLAENPYKSLYADDWMKKIGASKFLSHYRCITDLVQHIHDETKNMYEGTEHEDDWLFYHDALSLMTAKDTVAWMKEKGIYERWLLPVNGLNAGTTFEGRPVGNSPEFMPMDNSLNKDVDDGVRHHMAYTFHLKDHDKKKFTLSTPTSIRFVPVSRL
jgi:hypothetical protein